MRGLIDFVDQLQRKRINFQSLTDGINTESATGPRVMTKNMLPKG